MQIPASPSSRTRPRFHGRRKNLRPRQIFFLTFHIYKRTVKRVAKALSKTAQTKTEKTMHDSPRANHSKSTPRHQPDILNPVFGTKPAIKILCSPMHIGARSAKLRPRFPLSGNQPYRLPADISGHQRTPTVTNGHLKSSHLPRTFRGRLPTVGYQLSTTHYQPASHGPRTSVSRQV